MEKSSYSSQLALCWDCMGLWKMYSSAHLSMRFLVSPHPPAPKKKRHGGPNISNRPNQRVKRHPLISKPTMKAASLEPRGIFFKLQEITSTFLKVGPMLTKSCFFLVWFPGFLTERDLKLWVFFGSEKFHPDMIWYSHLSWKTWGFEGGKPTDFWFKINNFLKSATFFTQADWWFQPIWRILVKLEIFPKFRGEN